MSIRVLVVDDQSLIREGLARLETLEDELGTPFEWRRLGFLALIGTQQLWDDWVARAAVLTAAGIPTDVLDRQALQAAERPGAGHR